MKLIVGLGNPGKKYAYTRHNAGFLLLDKISKSECLLPFREDKNFLSEITEQGPTSNRIIYAKPLTFMNLSGQAVAKIAAYYHIKSKDMLIINDDVDLNFGTLRLRSNGSSGGHHGLDSIIEHIKSDDFWRLKIGVNNENINSKLSTDKLVLQKFGAAEVKKLPKVLDEAEKIVLEWAEGKGEEKSKSIE